MLRQDKSLQDRLHSTNHSSGWVTVDQREKILSRRQFLVNAIFGATASIASSLFPSKINRRKPYSRHNFCRDNETRLSISHEALFNVAAEWHSSRASSTTRPAKLRLSAGDQRCGSISAYARGGRDGFHRV